MLILLYYSFVLLVFKDVLAFRPLILPAHVNSTLSSNGTLSPAPKEPHRLINMFVHPPVAVDFSGYGNPISQGSVDVCLYKALDEALNTRQHSMLTPIATRDLDYNNDNVSLNFDSLGLAIWEEWKNVLYLILGFVDKYDTREFFFATQVLCGSEWYRVGRGYLGTI
jgi:hypothetical protein